MSKQPRVINPFYVLLTITGAAFVITACLYGVMTVKMLDPTRAIASSARSPAGSPAETSAGASAASGDELIAFVDRHGMTALLGQLAVLAATTVLAIATDDFWARRAALKAEQQSFN